jgi:pteridine reductase
VSTAAKSRQGAEPCWALVTGGARRIGAEIARELHGRGCSVIVHYQSSADQAAQLVAGFDRQRPDSAVAVQADLTAAHGPEQLAAEVLAITPRLGLLVNNASRFYPTAVGEVSHEQWKDLMGSNLRGPFFLVQALRETLRGGAVVNILDIHARRPLAGHSVYSIAKAGLEMLTLALARELAPETRVNGVAPGAILWPKDEPDDAAKAALLQRVALGRLGEPRDIAGAVAFLGLDAPYVTGQVLVVDGGRSLTC